MKPLPAVGAEVSSPCINVCRMDDASGLCEGCMRSLDEIAAWAGMDVKARRQIWMRLSQRRVAWRRQRRDGGPLPEQEGPP